MRKTRPWLLSVLVLISALSWSQQANLWESIEAGDAAAVERYLESGGDPNGTASSPPNEPVPLLKVALFDREQAIALILLRAGADFESLGENLWVVTREGLDDVLRFLLTQEPERLARAIAEEGGMNVVLSPSVRGYADVLELVLTEAERQRITWDPAALTEALAASISFRQNDTARMLLQHGAVPTGMVLRVAARDGSPGLVRTLLELGVDPSARLAERDVDPIVNARTAVEYAWKRYNSDPSQREPAKLIIRALIDAGARNEDAVTGEQLAPLDILRIDPVTEPAERLFFAARFGYLDEAAALLRSPGFNGPMRAEAAKIALVEQQNDVARLLIESGVPINDGILHAAARGNSPAIVRLLISLGADAALSSEGMTPIQHWLERQQRGYIGIGGDYVLYELIEGGAPACWLREHESSLDAVTHMFLKSGAPECWVEQ